MLTQTSGFNFFAIRSDSLGDFDAHGNPIRRRRAHLKSRAGCKPCKARRIKVSDIVFNITYSNIAEKCDERLPSCGHCSQKGLIAKVSNERWSIPSSPKPTLASSCPSWVIWGSEMDIEETQVLNHFLTHTTGTMVIGSAFWNGKVASLALQV
jgi:hypothetical protein